MWGFCRILLLWSFEKAMEKMAKGFRMSDRTECELTHSKKHLQHSNFAFFGGVNNCGRLIY
jgi:hypothetical protein